MWQQPSRGQTGARAQTSDGYRRIDCEPIVDSLPVSDLQARQQIPALFGTLRVTQHVVASGNQLHCRAEISCAPRHRVLEPGGDDAEEHTGDQAGDERTPRAWTEEPEHQPD